MATSITVRLRRTRVEEVHVSVLVTDELLRVDAEGATRLDVPKVFEAAVELGRTAALAWRPDGDESVVVHPTQTPPPRDGE